MRRRLVPVLLATALLAAGCGGSGNESGGGGGSSSSAAGGGTEPVGKGLFKGTCGTCHTLADAGTNGTFGPNLDDIKPSKELVLATIKSGPGPMPAGLFTGQKAEEVASYVSGVAGG